MTTKQDTGGPAFPLQTWDQELHIPKTVTGMTLRDYFAANATDGDIEEYRYTGKLVSVVSTLENGRKEITTVPEVITREAAKYRYADAMLKARQA